MDVIPNSLFPKAPVRADDLTFLLDQIAYGHHCALLGASNTGKSALLNSLTAPDINQALAERLTASTVEPVLPSQTASTQPVSAIEKPYLPVFVDCLEAGNNEHALYEVIIRRIIDEFRFKGEQRKAAPSSKNKKLKPLISLTDDELVEIHHTLLDASSELAFRSAFASGLRTLLQSAQYRLLLILDEFDDAFANLPPWPFRQLRAAVNQHEDQIQYVVATSHQMSYLRQDDETYEFRELFQMTTRSLLPLADSDAKRLLSYLDSHEPDPPKAELVEMIIEVAGGHPGLLERVHGLISQHAILPGGSKKGDECDSAASEFAAALLKLNPIQKECQRLWQELEEPEQSAIRQLLRDDLDATSTRTLLVKGLLRETEPAALFCPLLALYLQTAVLEGSAEKPSENSDALTVDPETGQIWANGEEITWVLASEHQRSLVRLLCKRNGHVSTYDEIAEHVYGVGEGVSPGAIRELINRTRKKLPDPGYIINVPGEGYRLKI